MKRSVHLRSRLARPLGLLLGALLLPGSALAQSVEEALGTLAQENARLYLEPVTRGFGHALSSTFFEGAQSRGLLSFNVGVRAAAALPPERANTFRPVLPAQVHLNVRGTQESFQDPYTASGNAESPTASGRGPGLVAVPQGQLLEAIEETPGADPEDYHLRFPDGLDIPAVPFVVLEGNLGVGLSTELNLRVIPSLEISDELGAMEALGVGIRHSLSDWIMLPTPVDVAVTGGVQSFSAGNYLSASGRSVGVAVGRSLGAVSVFAEGGVHTASLTVNYELENEALGVEGQRTRFSADTGASGRLAAGVHLQLALLSVSGQFAAGDYNSVSIRAGLGTP